MYIAAVSIPVAAALYESYFSQGKHNYRLMFGM